jgi:AraC-like DNA-binding protein
MNLCQAVMAAPSLDIAFEQHAENAGASVRTLARLFKDGLGMGFAEWRRQVQLATAVAELIQGCRSVPSPVNWVIRRAVSVTCSVNWVSRRRIFRPVTSGLTFSGPGFGRNSEALGRFVGTAPRLSGISFGHGVCHELPHFTGDRPGCRSALRRLDFRSPAPPAIALVGLLGMLAGEKLWPMGRLVAAGSPETLLIIRWNPL